VALAVFLDVGVIARGNPCPDTARVVNVGRFGLAIQINILNPLGVVVGVFRPDNWRPDHSLIGADRLRSRCMSDIDFRPRLAGYPLSAASGRHRY